MFLLLLLLWIIFNGKITFEIFITGVVISFFLTIFFNKFFFKEEDNTKNIFKKFLMLIEYFVVLIYEIIKANISVFSLILKRDIDIEPCFCYFKTKLKQQKSRILLANSITLTPGTITVELNEKGEYKVHCLDKSLSNGINESVFVKMLEKMEEV